MIVRYKSKKLEKVCTDYKEAKKKYGILMAEEIMDASDFLNLLIQSKF